MPSRRGLRRRVYEAFTRQGDWARCARVPSRAGGGAAGPVSADSIVYIKGGTPWRASPDGERRAPVLRPPGAWFAHEVVQDDHGTAIVAMAFGPRSARGSLWRVNARGRVLRRHATLASILPRSPDSTCTPLQDPVSVTAPR